MKWLSIALAALTLTGCMCRPGVVDCTTNRAYPAFCKPLCGGPCDPFMWVAGDCETCCCCAIKGGYTPYGGRTCCGDDMVYSPSCVAPPLRWAPPAQPAPPFGHTVYGPGPATLSAGPASPAPPPSTQKPPAPPTAPPSEQLPPEEDFEPPLTLPPDELEPEVFSGPRILHDARNDRPERSRR